MVSFPAPWMLALALSAMCVSDATLESLLKSGIQLQSGRGMFVSNNGLYCGEGLARVAESALALKKAAPYGAMFSNSFVRIGQTCAGHGFALDLGEDGCTPGMTAYFKAKPEVAAYGAAFQSALDSYRAKYQLTEDVVSLMANCTCQAGSAFITDQCAALDEVIGCWVHENPYNGDQLLCDQGPFIYATRVLSVLKSSPQLPMHFHDQIRARNCSSLGFPSLFSPPDHCYPAMRIWTKTSIYTDPSIKEAEWVESNLTHGGFAAFAHQHGFGDLAILNNSLACNCLSNSTVGHQMKGLCPAHTNHSPVRDWWSGSLGNVMTVV